MNTGTDTHGPGGPSPEILPAIDAENDFREAMRRRELIPPDNLIADGKIHRCDVEGKHGKGDGSYLLYLDGFPAGGFENHRDGTGWEKWRARGVRGLSPKDRAAHTARLEAARRQHEADRAKRQAEAREEAARIWEATEHCESHPYLTRKGVRPYGVRVDDDRLVVQVRDTEKVLHSLQFVDGEGNKMFLTGGRKKGCYHAMGKAADAGVIYIAEGYATAASVHEAMGGAVAAAFDCGNLRPVAEALRAKYPDAKIVLCADDDYQRENNPGRTHATEAARAVGGLVAVPTFGESRPEGATDFNDLHQAQGLDAVRACIEAAAPPAGAATHEAAQTCAGVTVSYGGGRFRTDDDGVWFDPPAKDDADTPDPPRWLCSRLDVRAITRDKRGEDWGRLLVWRDADGQSHTWPMPAELLAGDGADVRRELLRRGVQIGPTQAARNLLTAYLTVSRPEARARCVDRVGWYGGVYVLPDTVIGEADEIVCYQRASAVESAFSIRGTVEEWRSSLAALAVGNSRLVFAISAAFAGSLADLAAEDGGGFHFRGGSSGGKTTALRLAASIWGDPAVYVRTWRATANGLEAVAALHNDGLLLLDELGQIDPREAGGAAYLLANGHGKARASVTGAARRAAGWRLLFLSAGEQSLASLVAEGGRRLHAGQEIRLADVDADAGAGMGIVEQLNGHASPAALVDAIREAAARNYGTVGIEWLRLLVPDRAKIAAHVAANVTQVAAALAPAGASGQAELVARRFALVAIAGEMATAYGLTGWPEGEAVTAARRCFEAWLAGFGGGVGRREDRAILAHVRGFIEAHGQSRFQQWDASDSQKVIDRAGFWRDVEGERRYYVLTETFQRELCTGFDLRNVVRVLKATGALEPGGDGKSTRKERLPGIGPARCYVLTPRVWEGEE
jgi:phage/plasmid primase-like uncharacterized protein